MISREDLVKAGADNLSDILISIYENNPALQKQLDITFAGLNESPKKLISAIKKEISSLKRSKGFIDYYGSDSLASRLDQLRNSIAEDLKKKSPEDAIKLMHDFFNLHFNTIERCDDSNGTVGEVFVQSCEDLGKMYSESSKDQAEVAELVFDIFTKDNYGICGNAIIDFKDSLQEQGLNHLKSKLKNSNTEGYYVAKGLKDIADCRKNIDEYIEACSFKNSELTDHDYIEITSRYINAWDSKKALEWINKVDKDNIRYQNEATSLRIKALELDGDYKQVEKERVEWFNKTLSPELYGKILSNAKSDFKEQFKKSAIQKAYDFSDPHQSVKFFIDIQEFEECANLVHLKYEKMDGSRYYTLRPAAKILQQIDPLAAILLYRKMVQPVLDAAKSKYYNYASKDLALCTILSEKVSDWKGHTPHDLYFQQIKESHKRKVSFWPQYQDALQKSIAKEIKKTKE